MSRAIAERLWQPKGQEKPVPVYFSASGTLKSLNLASLLRKTNIVDAEVSVTLFRKHSELGLFILTNPHNPYMLDTSARSQLTESDDPNHAARIASLSIRGLDRNLRLVAGKPYVRVDGLISGNKFSHYGTVVAPYRTTLSQRAPNPPALESLRCETLSIRLDLGDTTGLTPTLAYEVKEALGDHYSNLRSEI